MEIETFFDAATYTLTHVVHDPSSRDAVVIDPVLDYDPTSSTVTTRSVEAIAAFLRSKDLRLRHVLETHAHADHLSGSQYLRSAFEAPVAIGARITEVQRVFKDIFDLGLDFATDGRQFETRLEDGHRGRSVHRGRAVHRGLWHRPLRLPGWQRRRALHLGARPALCAARRDARLRGARLPAGGPRAAGADDHWRVEGRERAALQRHDAGGVRRHAPWKGCDAGGATPPLPERAGQHRRRAPARTALERTAVPVHPGAGAL
jgi:hypothetical protein